MFDMLVDKVCEVCDVDLDLVINGSRRHDVVEARILAVQYLRRIGLTFDDISLIVLRKVSGDKNFQPSMKDVKLKAKAVQKMFNSYSQYCLDSYSFCLMSRDIQEFCHSKYKEYYLGWMKHLPSTN